MTAPMLTALVVAHNEEARLRDCLKPLRFADEIVVVLDKCTDGSREIAAELADKLVEGSWDIEGGRRNTGIDACRGDWILEIDADERVSPELADEIRATIGISTADWHEIPVDNYIGERLVRHGWGAAFGKSAYGGLFRKGAKHWGEQRVHPAVAFTGRKGPQLKTPLEHYVDRNISDMIVRLDRYTTARAHDLRERGDFKSMASDIRRIFTRFYKCYVTRKGYREGGYGFLIALFAGLYPILSHLKARLEDE